MTTKRGRKIKAVIDEDLLGSDFTKLSKKVKLITSNQLMGRSGAQDIEIYEKSNNQDYHIITANTSDFKAIQKSHPQFKTGIIGIRATNIDKSIANLSKIVSNDMPYHEQYYKKCIEISSQGKIVRIAGNTTTKSTIISSKSD